jgi:hypothetical protein
MVIGKDFRGIEERDPVLLLILAGFLGVPFKYQHDGSYGSLTIGLRRARFHACRLQAIAVVQMPEGTLSYAADSDQDRKFMGQLERRGR